VQSAPPFSQKIRKWQWPVKGKVIAKFSTAEQGNKGIDIAGRRGEKVRTSADGKVVYAGNALRGYGKLVIIKHNEDYLSAYAHNDSIMVKEQQVVKRGDVIAKMGDTDAQRVMLHFEVRFRGKSVNPLKYLPKK
jgi:lipoprotein NlpD